MSAHRTTRLARLVTVTLAAGALAAPAAGARPAPLDAPGTAPEPDVPTQPVTQTINDGFDWGSAAIGAGGAGSVIVLVSLGGFVLSSRAGHARVAR